MAGVELPDGTREATPQGVPQGGPLSPLLANIALDPLDKELESRGHQFARYADDFIVLVKSANAAKRVLASLIRYCEGRLKLIVNRAKSRAAPLKSCEFLGYPLNNRAKLAWTDKAQHRFKERIREITSRNRGHKVQTVIDELNLYLRGWLNYYKLSSTYKEVLALSVWVRRRVRLYYWKQWKQPRTRRRHLLALGADPATVHMATRSRKGYWRMSQNEIVRYALNNRWLEEQGVPDMNAPDRCRGLPKAKPAAGPLQQIHPAVAVLVVLKHRLAAVAARHHVVNRSRRLVSQGSCHERLQSARPNLNAC